MIPLRLPMSAPADGPPFVVRLNRDAGLRDTPFDSYLEACGADLVFDGPGGRLILRGVEPEDVDGDVLLAVPGRGVAHRLIRAASVHNTFLVTERCDQLCVMCSQPPKPQHVDRFDHFENAALLSPAGAVLGISGGEPTLFKDRLFAMMDCVAAARPDVTFHVLTNGQHFSRDDLDALRRLRSVVAWGVPVYAAEAETHDVIVGKTGAFARLRESLAVLCEAGSSLEIRTVLLQSNLQGLARLARFLTIRAPFAVRWAIMHLENIGYGRRNWADLFVDTSLAFAPVAEAVDLARAAGLDAVLYNFPRCTVPAAYRSLAPSTISDWKRRYLDACGSCRERDRCGGFFEWYPDRSGFREVHPL